MTPHKPNKHRVSYVELYAFAVRLEENPDGEWQPIPTRSPHASQTVHRQRNGMIPALPPERFESRQLKGVAVARAHTNTEEGKK